MKTFEMSIFLFTEVPIFYEMGLPCIMVELQKGERVIANNFLTIEDLAFWVLRGEFASELTEMQKIELMVTAQRHKLANSMAEVKRKILLFVLPEGLEANFVFNICDPVEFCVTGEIISLDDEVMIDIKFNNLLILIGVLIELAIANLISSEDGMLVLKQAIVAEIGKVIQPNKIMGVSLIDWLQAEA